MISREDAQAGAGGAFKLNRSINDALFTNMSTMELESAVKKLAPEDLKVFTDWFEHYISDLWDHQIEKDILSGRLDHLAAKADADFEAGRCSPL